MSPPLNTGNRLASMLLDHIIMTFAVMVFAIPVMISSFANMFTVTHEQPNTNLFGEMSYVMLFGFALYFCKDSFNGRSIAKRIMKLQVVNHTTGEPASPLRCFARNIFCIVWPIEVIVTLSNPSRRIGDRVAGTKVVAFDQATPPRSANWLQIILSIGFAYGLMLAVMAPYQAIQSVMELNQQPFVESSYNELESNTINKSFADSFDNLIPDIRVYDKMEHEDTKYISAILHLNNDELFEKDRMEELHSFVMAMLHEHYPSGTFKGQVQYVYKSGSSIRITREYIY